VSAGLLQRTDEQPMGRMMTMDEQNVEGLALVTFAGDKKLDVPFDKLSTLLDGILQVTLRLQPRNDDDRLKLRDERIESLSLDMNIARHIATIVSNNPDAKLPTLRLEFPGGPSMIQPFALETTASQAIFTQAVIHPPQST
jgi:hypothetical protein